MARSSKSACYTGMRTCVALQHPHQKIGTWHAYSLSTGGGGTLEDAYRSSPSALAHQWAPGSLRDLSPKKVENNRGRHPPPTCGLHTCAHMNMYTHTYYTLGRHPHAYTPFLLSFLSLFHSLFSFLFPSFLLLLTEWFFYIAQADSKLLILQLHPTTTSVCSPGTSHKPVIPFSICNSNCFPLENQKTEEKLDHPTAAFFPLAVWSWDFHTE